MWHVTEGWDNTSITNNVCPPLYRPMSTAAYQPSLPASLPVTSFCCTPVVFYLFVCIASCLLCSVSFNFAVCLSANYERSVLNGLIECKQCLWYLGQGQAASHSAYPCHRCMWCVACPPYLSSLFCLFLLLALADSIFATFFLLFLSLFVLLLNTFYFVPTHLLSFPMFIVSGLCRSLPSSPPHLSSSVPIRRNLIGNQSFWWKNGAGLSITVPWVLPAERGVQKRLHIGTAVGKVNAADSLSLAVAPCVQSFSLTHTLLLFLYSRLVASQLLHARPSLGLTQLGSLFFKALAV